MANRPQNFKIHDVRRAIRAARAEGVPNPSVEFHSPDGGKIVVRTGALPAAAVAKPVAKVRTRPVVPARRPTR
jgi:hypothetical protein